MNVRERREAQEASLLSPYAAHSVHSRGRDRAEPECDVRTVYQRDRDRILHSKSFRRLKDKTQVFLAPKGDHYRTRLMHTLEVSQTARTIACALCMNEDLTEAIALGHDLGHTPFGHTGEAALNACRPGGFRHNEQSVRTVEVIEKKGRGLNLTWEVRDGIRNHKTSGNPATLEGKIVRYSDKIAYVNSDIDDAIRAGILTEDDLPSEFRRVLGGTSRERLNTLIHDIVDYSRDKNDILMSPSVDQALRGLRAYMMKHVYHNSIAKEEEAKAVALVKKLYAYYEEHFEELPEHYRALHSPAAENREQVVCDYIAGMTDRFAIDEYRRLFIPRGWEKR
ncbi:MAG: deoxyguanosinetriphosphate triphosphohydrolase [Eubacteriales bacterium]|nr:deoxyguanosinetriphosphate triphosphohydrolase [Eubacteriales bacterium]